MSDAPWESTPTGLTSDEIAFDYVKSSDFRAIRADGAIGGITPFGFIHVALYSERVAIPRRQVFKLTPPEGASGTLGPEVREKAISRGSIVREMSCDLFLTPEVAKNIAEWLLKQVSEAEAAGAATREDSK